MKNTNVIDKPRMAGAPDLLGVDDYMHALIKFIESCNMPTTIAIQGEWGSGKTSMLNQIKHNLCETGLDTNLDKHLPYYGIWINTWQYSLMKSKEETLIAIIEGITREITKIIKRKHETSSQAIINNVTGMFNKLVKAGAKAAVKQVGMEGDVIDDLLEVNDDAVDLLNFKKSLQEAIQKCLEFDRKHGNNNRGFIFFIDDLDRIDPPVAVEILELIKNIFEVDNCIFVLAIDYDVVVKGLVPKFGPLTEKNEREFRSFFDKIIQLPFSMPIAMYDVNHFLLQSLEDIGYIDEDIAANDMYKDKLTDFSMLSVGTNPRSLKRLINTLSLLNIISGLKSNYKKEVYELVVNFGLVCIQIAYPKIYQILSEEPDFKSWNEKTAKKLRLEEISDNQISIINGSSEFDEEWEKVLFRICMTDPYLLSRAFQISQLLNFIGELIPNDLDLGDEMTRILGSSTVTSVSMDYIPKQSKKGERIRYEGWLGFEKMLSQKAYNPVLINTLKEIHDWAHKFFDKKIKINFTPNFMTFACVNSISRSKTFCFIRMKNDLIRIEYAKGPSHLKVPTELSQEIKDGIVYGFNNSSKDKI